MIEYPRTHILEHRRLVGSSELKAFYMRTHLLLYEFRKGAADTCLVYVSRLIRALLMQRLRHSQLILIRRLMHNDYIVEVGDILGLFYSDHRGPVRCRAHVDSDIIRKRILRQFVVIVYDIQIYERRVLRQKSALVFLGENVRIGAQRTQRFYVNFKAVCDSLVNVGMLYVPLRVLQRVDVQLVKWPVLSGWRSCEYELGVAVARKRWRKPLHYVVESPYERRLVYHYALCRPAAQ